VIDTQHTGQSGQRRVQGAGCRVGREDRRTGRDGTASQCTVRAECTVHRRATTSKTSMRSSIAHYDAPAWTAVLDKLKA
jgi:hypothetical protein